MKFTSIFFTASENIFLVYHKDTINERNIKHALIYLSERKYFLGREEKKLYQFPMESAFFES